MESVDYTTYSIEELNKEKDKNNLEAIYTLGRRYATGADVEQNVEYALQLLDRVHQSTADPELSDLSGTALAEIYLTDKNYYDFTKALSYIGRPIEHNNTYARFVWGSYCTGVTEDFNCERTEEEQIEGFEMLSGLYEETKDITTAGILAMLYCDGIGTKIDLEKAKQFAEIADKGSIEDPESNQYIKELLDHINTQINESKGEKVMADIKQSDQVLSESKLAQLTAVDFTDGSTLESLMNSLITSMQNKGIACDAKYAQIKTGNILKSSLEPACIFYHPEHVDDYYYYVFAFKQQGNMGRLFIYKGGNSTQISKENFNQDMKNSGGGILTKTIKLAARGVNAIGKDKSKLQDEQLYYSSFEQNVIDTFHIHNK